MVSRLLVPLSEALADLIGRDSDHGIRGRVVVDIAAENLCAQCAFLDAFMVAGKRAINQAAKERLASFAVLECRIGKNAIRFFDDCGAFAICPGHGLNSHFNGTFHMGNRHVDWSGAIPVRIARRIVSPNKYKRPRVLRICANMIASHRKLRVKRWYCTGGFGGFVQRVL